MVTINEVEAAKKVFLKFLCNCDSFNKTNSEAITSSFGDSDMQDTERLIDYHEILSTTMLKLSIVCKRIRDKVVDKQ